MTPTERINERERMRRSVEACFEDYRKALLAYAEWMDAWRKRCKQQ